MGYRLWMSYGELDWSVIYMETYFLAFHTQVILHKGIQSIGITAISSCIDSYDEGHALR